jgi:hypothetical protein
MTIRTGQVTVTDSTGEIFTPVANSVVRIKNLGVSTNKVFIGPSGVTISNGYSPEEAGFPEYEMAITISTAIHGVTQTGSRVVEWIEIT